MDKTTSKLDAIKIKRLSGQEPFVCGAQAVNSTLSNFWAWSVSDLVSNATRGRLAEYIVGLALDCDLGSVRDEWQAWDLTTKDGIKVEVKSAGYIQSWAQKGLSKISFSVKKSLAWERESNVMAKVATRQADVYVFALHDHQDKATVNPIVLDQWRFWVLPSAILNERRRSQHSITLKSLEVLAGPGCGFMELTGDLVKQQLQAVRDAQRSASRAKRPQGGQDI